MVDHLPHDILMFIVTLVATSSITDLFRLRQCCKTLNNLIMNEGIINCVSMNEISLISRVLGGDENRNLFFRWLEACENPEFCFRMALINIRDREPNYESAIRFLEISFRQGHDGAKYCLAILYIFAGDDNVGGIGRQYLIELLHQDKLFKCREMIKKSFEMDRAWRIRRSWPDNLVYSKCCLNEAANIVCVSPSLKRGVWMATMEDDFMGNYCVRCRLDMELDWLINEIAYDPPEAA